MGIVADKYEAAKGSECSGKAQKDVAEIYLTRKPMSLVAIRMPPEQTSRLQRKIERSACISNTRA